MDRLRSAGGCPWDAAQSHRSLVRYLLEEAYEAAEAIEVGSREDLREELGDVLLQVVFHASIAAGEAEAFDLDDIAGQVADKLVRRHPQVFAADAGPTLTAEQSYEKWDRIKEVEKRRTSVLDGIPLAQSALARAQKVVGRARRGGVGTEFAAGVPAPGASLGERLLALAAEAEAAGLDAEAELRAATREVERQIQGSEKSGRVGQNLADAPE
jgi:XTP/dITP diphosphohydrolase